MGTAYKSFLNSDIKVSPLNVSKGYTFSYDDFTLDNVGIDLFQGVSGSYLTDKTTTGLNSTQSKVLIYNSIKELYYSNFISKSTGDDVAVPFIFPGQNSEGDVLVGSSNSSGRYFNYLTSDLTQSRFFPTGANAQVGVISIPSKLFGDYIVPSTFSYVFTSGSTFNLNDDGEGNILSGSDVVGNIIYQHGIAIITDPLLASGSISTTDVTCSFSSSLTIYETQYKCTIRENEFNYSLNPTLVSSSNFISGSWYNFSYPTGSVYDFVTSSYFNPYITTIGLYNENKELLAVAKLAQPIQTSNITDVNIMINIDF